MRPGRRPSLAGRSFAGSVGVHVALIGLIALASGLGPSTPPPPRIIPLVITPPSATPTPKPRASAIGDLAVRDRNASPTPPPMATPKPTPKPTPTPSATPKPAATPKPKPTPAPTAKPTPRPVATPNAAEKKKLEQMRKIPYFAKMTDEELKKQPIPPGFKDWGQVMEMGRKLDGLQWLFLPPETGVTPTTAPSGSPSPMPSPTVTRAEDGTNTMAFQVEKTVFTVTWKDGDANAVAVVKPEDAKPEDAGRTFEVPVDPDPAKFLQAVLDEWAKVLAASPSPAPTP